MSGADVVVIEADTDVRSALRDVLEELGHTVREAANGRDGLGLVERRAPDLVITDLLMPVGDGVEVLWALRDGWPAVPILAMSGTSVVVPAELTGAVAFLPKPFGLHELREALARLLR